VRNGGFVIVEYQPWKSYENDKAINEYIRYERRLGAKCFYRLILVLRKPDAATTPIEHHAADNCPSEDSIHAKSSKCNSDNSGCTGADTTVTTLSNSHRERHCMLSALSYHR
jgi:hypothetical protein